MSLVYAMWLHRLHVSDMETLRWVHVSYASSARHVRSSENNSQARTDLFDQNPGEFTLQGTYWIFR
jgi:hypothetical protein